MEEQKMSHEGEFFIDGRWQSSAGNALLDVVNPATEQVHTRIASGNSLDINLAVQAARAAFPGFAKSSLVERAELLQNIFDGFERRVDDLVAAISIEIGVPLRAAREIHYPSGPGHLKEILRVLREFKFEELKNNTLIIKEAIGVCGLITPWNFPINQVVCKLAPALAAGNTIVLKPSEIAPLSALIIAEIVREAGAPPGVFNLVNGSGSEAGHALTTHPDVDMISFTGSTRAGVAISKAAADTVKRVTLELGGKSANILLPDVDFQRAVTLGVSRCFNNSGQSCIAPSRMLVPQERLGEVIEIARRAAESTRVGPPEDVDAALGPVANRAQFEKIQRLIALGVQEGATLVAGGMGRPEGLTRGYFVRPTVFANVTPEMTIAREEIFGPVLSIMTYRDETQAQALANGTPYGLAAYVQAGSPARARDFARTMRAGVVQINYPPVDRGAPFGGYKQSGNGREWGEYGLHEYLEVKALVGYGAD
jgi:aldehyde dehydrogenase (NAD+)